MEEEAIRVIKGPKMDTRCSIWAKGKSYRMHNLSLLLVVSRRNNTVNT
jgi:hypothetical protein